MFRHDVKKQKSSAINVIMHQGGLGDLIMQLPAMQGMLRDHGYHSYFFWCHEYGVELLKEVLNYDKVYSIDQIPKLCNVNLIGKSPYGGNQFNMTNLAMHGVDHGFYTLVGNIPTNPELKNYPRLDPIDIRHLNLPKDYVAISTGFTSDSREWKPEIVKEVTDRIVKELGLPVIYLGKQAVKANKDHEIKGKILADTSNGIDLIDQTSLFETHAVIAGSKAILGVDNGLLHLAGMTDVPIVAGYTSVDPKHRMPYRNNILGFNVFTVTPDIGCRFCQSNMTLTFGHEFTACYYEDFACLKQLNAEKWMKALRMALGRT